MRTALLMMAIAWSAAGCAAATTRTEAVPTPTAEAAVAPLVIVLDADSERKSCVTLGSRLGPDSVRPECCPEGFSSRGIRRTGNTASYGVVCMEDTPSGRAVVSLYATNEMKTCIGVGYSPQVCCPDGWQYVGQDAHMSSNVVCLSPAR